MSTLLFTFIKLISLVFALHLTDGIDLISDLRIVAVQASAARWSPGKRSRPGPRNEPNAKG